MTCPICLTGYLANCVETWHLSAHHASLLLLTETVFPPCPSPQPCTLQGTCPIHSRAHAYS